MQQFGAAQSGPFESRHVFDAFTAKFVYASELDQYLETVSGIQNSVSENFRTNRVGLHLDSRGGSR